MEHDSYSWRVLFTFVAQLEQWNINKFNNEVKQSLRRALFNIQHIQVASYREGKFNNSKLDEKKLKVSSHLTNDMSVHLPFASLVISNR